METTDCCPKCRSIYNSHPGTAEFNELILNLLNLFNDHSYLERRRCQHRYLSDDLNKGCSLTIIQQKWKMHLCEDNFCKISIFRHLYPHLIIVNRIMMRIIITYVLYVEYVALNNARTADDLTRWLEKLLHVWSLL